MAGRRLVDCSLKDLLGDQQIAWWLVGCTAVYAVLSVGRVMRVCGHAVLRWL